MIFSTYLNRNSYLQDGLKNIHTQNKEKLISIIFRESYEKRQPETDWRPHYFG